MPRGLATYFWRRFLLRSLRRNGLTTWACSSCIYSWPHIRQRAYSADSRRRRTIAPTVAPSDRIFLATLICELCGLASFGMFSTVGPWGRQAVPTPGTLAGQVIKLTVVAGEAGFARRSPSRLLSDPSPYSACRDSSAPSSGRSHCWPFVGRSARRLESRHICREPSAAMRGMGQCQSIHTPWVSTMPAETPRMRRSRSTRSLPGWPRMSTSQSDKFSSH